MNQSTDHQITQSPLQPSCTIGVLDWHLYIIQEYVAGGSLSQALHDRWFWDRVRNEPNVAAILSIAQDVASAMSYLHSKNIIHGKRESV